MLWLGQVLQTTPLIGFPLNDIRSHKQEFLGIHGRNTCVVAAAQNADRLLRGPQSRFQNMSTDEMIALLDANASVVDPTGMNPDQATALLRAMGFVVDPLVRANIPAIVTVLKQGGVVIEHGGPEKHARVIANVEGPRVVYISDILEQAGFWILDSAWSSLSPYRNSARDFTNRVHKVANETSYIGIRLLQSQQGRQSRVKIRS